MNDRRPHDAIYPDQAKEAQAQAIADHEATMPEQPAHVAPGSRPHLLDDLAVLKLHLEDDLINDGQAGEALARVVGALHLTPEEEDWLEGQ